ncbi:MAG: hypothetical protein FJ211_09775 [Ignavibacteria bacterium]|nr:hypothetical protein [Ignavibacteria bacterium]
MTPLRPTFNSVFANWNEQHKNVFGSYLNTATASKEDVDRQAKELEETTLRLQQEWDSLYGDTPEGKIIKENPPPEWTDVYSAWSNLYKEQFGSELLDRPWNADADAKAQKEALDQAYLAEIQDYNQRFGTNLQPDNTVLGVNVQPNAFYKEPEKKWYKNPIKAALAVAALYFGGQYVLGSLGSGAAAGTAAGTGAGTGAAVGGTAGVSTVYPVAGWAGTVTPIAPTVGAGAAGAGLLASSAPEAASLANYSVAPGSLQAALPELGVQTAATTAPFTAAPGSFQAALPGLLSGTGAGTSLLDAAKTASRVANLFGPQTAAASMPFQPQAGASAPARGVDLSTLYNPLNLPVGLLPIAELYRRPSLLG